MKNDHSCQAGNGAKPASATDGNATGFTRMRSKLAFDRLVEMGARMGMENPLFLCHERAAKATTLINGREYLNFSTYDYLDINAHPEITEAVTKAAALYGTSAGASRLVGGERPPHRELERALAELYGVEDCIVYVSGHATNVSTLGFLFGHRDAIFHDGLAHNSLVQGARLSGATRYSYAHNDCDALEELLRNKRAEHKRAIIVTEGLFSMDGNIPDLPRIIALKKKYDCMLLVDEAHSLGVLGATGRGAREYFNIDPTDVDMWMSTLSKSMCGCGGFIAGSHELVEFLKYGSPGFVFSVGMPPVIAVACVSRSVCATCSASPSFSSAMRRRSAWIRAQPRAMPWCPSWWATRWWRAFCPTPCSNAGSTSCPSPSRPSKKARTVCASFFPPRTPKTTSAERWTPYAKPCLKPGPLWTNTNAPTPTRRRATSPLGGKNL